MIYALLSHDADVEIRKKIATAVRNRDADTIKAYVDNSTIVHIQHYLEQMDGVTVFCIWCRDIVEKTPMNQPKDREPDPKRYWFFKHTTIADCNDKLRRPPKSDALEIRNPGKQGCYVLLNREDVEDRDRKSCQTKVGNLTYCHLAGECDCL